MSIHVDDELREFHRFLTEKLKSGDSRSSPEDVLGEWRELHPDPQDEADDLEAIRESLDDPGIPFAEFDREFRKLNNIPGKS